FGTQSGSVWTAPQGGGSWTEAVRDLPPILSVEAAPACRGDRRPARDAGGGGRRAEAVRARGGDRRRRFAPATGLEPPVPRERRAPPADQRLRRRDRRA